MNILISILGGVIAGLIIGYFIWRKRDPVAPTSGFSTSAQGEKTDSLIFQKEEEKAANLENKSNRY